MENGLENIMNLHGWEIERQSYLDIKGTDYTLSVIPEYSFYDRDKNGRIFRSSVPQYVTLNTCVYNRKTGKSITFFNINSEDEFLDFMSELQKQLKLEAEWQD
jgi:hypothetical protein